MRIEKDVMPDGQNATFLLNHGIEFSIQSNIYPRDFAEILLINISALMSWKQELHVYTFNMYVWNYYNPSFRKMFSWWENCIWFFLMLLMWVLTGNTYTSFPIINSHNNAHISKIFSEYFVHNTNCCLFVL